MTMWQEARGTRIACIVAGLVAAAVAGLSGPPALALSRQKTVDRLADATTVLHEVLNIPEGIPDSLLSKSEAVIVIPHVVEGAFLFGGRAGYGVMVRRQKGRWSNPCYVALKGGSFGLQLGGQAVDLILLVQNARGVDAILSDNFTFSGDASATAGPVGRNAEAGTDLTLRAGILSYSRSKGLFAGISIQGATLTIDRKANYTFYQKLIDHRKILSDALMPYP
jgi:lipid-binding SYLF domain-containing protein